MNKKNFGFAMIIFALLLSACAADAPAPTATETEPTFTVMPSLTPLPTKTTGQPPTVTPIQAKQTQITPTPTPVPFPTPVEDHFSVGYSISPSEEWIAWQMNCHNGGCYQFINQDGSKVWDFTVDDIKKVYDVDFRIRNDVAHWSQDNKFAYLVMSSVRSYGSFFYKINGMVKFSLENGTYSYIITPHQFKNRDSVDPTESFLYYGFDFSEDSQLLAYAIKSGQSIDFTILDLYSGETRYFSLVVPENTAFGDIAWSPNGEYFVFSSAENINGIVNDSDDFSVYLVKLADLSVKRVLPHGSRSIESPEWLSNKEVRYLDYDVAGTPFYIILNIETGEITEIENE